MCDRKRSCGVRDAEAEYRNSQVRVCAVQAEEKADGECTNFQGYVQYSEICGRKRARNSGCCRLFQLSKGNCC